MKNNKRILLIEPPFYRLFNDRYSLDKYPLALGYLAGTIKKETDWDVLAYNADFLSSGNSEKWQVSYLSGEGYNNYLRNLNDLSDDVWHEVRETIQEYNPFIIGISSKSQNFASACNVAKIAKSINNEIVVIVGGPHVSMAGKDVLNCPEIDICVKGEGEVTITELIGNLGSGGDLGSIKGIIYRRDGIIVENEEREFLKDLDSLCFPHQSAPEVLKDFDKYPLSALTCIFTVRGCPHSCFFCGSRNLWSRKVRFRSIENVIEEIQSLNKIGATDIHFDDDTFGVSRKRIIDLCEAIMTRCQWLRWSCEISINLIDEETVSIMKKAGCCEIQIGVESGSNQILKDMRKNITIEEAFSAANIIKKHSIKLKTFFIVGFPQETEESLKDTIYAMKKIKSDYLCYSIFTPYPGTEIFEYCRENGLIGDNYEAARFNHYSPANCFCMNLAPERFREIASKIEKMVDRKNWINHLKTNCSVGVFRKILRFGFSGSLRKGLKILLGK